MDQVAGSLSDLRLPGDLALSDGHVVLRSWRAEDADFLLASFEDTEARRQVPLIAPINSGIALRWIHEHAAHSPRPTSPAFLIIDAAGTRVGAIGATSIDWHAHRAEFFYWILEAHRGRGFAKAALATISSWALGAGLGRLELMIDVQNQISVGVARATGYRFERVYSGYRVLDGRVIDAAAYVRLAQTS